MPGRCRRSSPSGTTGLPERTSHGNGSSIRNGPAGWLTWSASTDPEPSIEALFSHEPLREEDPNDPRVAPDDSGIARVRHLTTAYDPSIILNGKRDGHLTVVERVAAGS